MVQVNNYSDTNRVPLLPEHVKPYTWFEYRGLLYLAIKWESKPSGDYDKFKLLAVCFDPDHYTMEAEFYSTLDVKVVIVADSKVSIFYNIPPEN